MTTPWSQTSQFPNDPPKKKRTAWWIGFIVALFVAMCIVGLFISTLAGGSKDVDPVNRPTTLKVKTSVTWSQIPAPAAKKATAAPTSKPVSVEQSNAAQAAKDYLEYQAFSRKGLIHQLSADAGEGYPVKVATAAVDSLHVDWNAQAARSAQNYLDYQSFSRSGLIHQLESDSGEGFTHKQAVYGVSKTGL